MGRILNDCGATEYADTLIMKSELMVLAFNQISLIRKREGVYLYENII